MPSDRWSDADRELVANAYHWAARNSCGPDNCPGAAECVYAEHLDWDAFGAVLDALTAAGWVRMDPDEPHLIEFRPNGWTIQHPVRCRPALFACEVNRVGESLPGPAGPPADGLGVYECSLDDGELTIGARRDG